MGDTRRDANETACRDKGWYEFVSFDVLQVNLDLFSLGNQEEFMEFPVEVVAERVGIGDREVLEPEWFETPILFNFFEADFENHSP